MDKCLGKVAAGALIYLMISVRVRILDFGGWLDTWFSEHGQVFNLAVLSRLFGSTNNDFLAIDVLFRLDTDAKRKKGSNGKVIIIAARDPHFSVTRERHLTKPSSRVCRKKLLLAVLSLCELEKLPDGDLVFRVMSPIPPGASMGTSAAVCVALIKAVNQLRAIYGLSVWSDAEVAELAFFAETKVMGGQSGTQDQWSAAFDWTAKVITIEQYPRTKAKQLRLTSHFMKRLERGLITVCVGAHNSSETHLEVIAAREREGAGSAALQPIRDAVEQAIYAATHSDLVAFGLAMTANSEAQRAMCPKLVGSKHQQVIDLAIDYDCLGYKVNGAGGEGGSVTLLFKSREEAEGFHAKLSVEHPGFESFEHRL